MTSMERDRTMHKASIRVALVVALIAFALCASACSAQAGSRQTQETDKPRLIATVFAPYDFARQVAGDKAEVRMLIAPGAETHSFEPTPADIKAIENCDIFVYVGGESDAWVTDLLDSLDTSDTQIVRLIDCVVTVDENDDALINPTEATDEGEGTEPDEHVWTSVANAKLITERIETALIESDPQNAANYRSNTEAYLQELDELDLLFTDIIAQAQRKTLVFGDRFPFRYFADEYGLICFAAFPGCSTATEASAQTIVALIDRVRDENLPAVFYLELSNQALANTIAEETGAQSLLLHSCHNISKVDFDAGASYVSIMRQNAENLRIALN